MTFCNLLASAGEGDTAFVNALPQFQPDGRCQRLTLPEITPAVLRFEDGRRTQGRLEVISAAGGLLGLPKTVAPQSCARLMFVTPNGPVLGMAEMLRPVSEHQQPFRFVELETGDRCRLQESIQTGFGEFNKEQEWIDKYRATLDYRRPEHGHALSKLIAAATVAVLVLGSAIYLLGIRLP